MTAYLAHIVANAHISRLSLVGLAKNVGKTTTTNHLVATLLGEQLYRADELALTSLGLDGEAIDALTGLPKPRYVPEAGMLVATTATLLLQAESEGARIERLRQLPGRTALGAVLLARIQHPGRIIIAGPTLLREWQRLPSWQRGAQWTRLRGFPSGNQPGQTPIGSIMHSNGCSSSLQLDMIERICIFLA